jgi:signal transduction histidine kinase
MKQLTWRSISFQVALMVLLPLTAGAIFISFYSQNLHHDAMQSLVGERDLRTVEAISLTVDEWIQYKQTILNSLAAQIGITSGLSDLPEGTEMMLDNYPGMVFLLAPSGEVTDMYGGSDPSGYDWYSFLEGIKTTPSYGQPNTLLTINHPDNPATFYAVQAVGIPNGSSLVGVINLQIELSRLFSDIIQPGEISVQVYDNQHRLIFDAGRTPLDSHDSYHPGVLNGLNGNSGVIYPNARTEHGQDAHVIAYAPVARSSWVLVLDEAWEDVSSLQLSTTQSAPLILIPFFLVAVISLWVIIRQVVIPLQKLENQTKALGEGDYTAVTNDVGGIAEIRSLQSRLAEMADNLQKARQSLRSYIGSITRGVEDERMRLSREIHDETLQSLIVLKHRMQSDTGVDEAENPKLVQEVVNNLRGIVRGLRPVILEDLGLVAALENLSNLSKQEMGIPVLLTVIGEETRHANDIELAFYRIAQESLMNIKAHSQATAAEIILKFEQKTLSMQIKDNGQGFTVPDQLDDMVRDGHFGLIGMMERAGLINASIQFISNPVTGTLIIVRYPDQ